MQNASGARIVSQPWDTEFFGFPIGRLEEGQEPAQLSDALTGAWKDYRLIYAFASPGSSLDNALASLARPVDQKVRYVRPTHPFVEAAAPSAASVLGQTPSSALIELAYQSGHYSRFNLDPGFSTEQFESLYRRWIERSVSGEIAREVLVIGDLVQPSGFITLGEKNGRGDIGLVAVAEGCRGRGIGELLVQEAFRHFAKWGCGVTQVVTQRDNAGACRFYERLGFGIEEVQHVYHLWRP